MEESSWFIFILWDEPQYAHCSHIWSNIIFDQSIKDAQKWYQKQAELFFLVSGFISWRLQAHVAESQWQVPKYQFLKWFFKTKCSDVNVMNEYVVLNDYWMDVNWRLPTLKIQLSEEWRGRSYRRWSTFENPALSMTLKMLSPLLIFLVLLCRNKCRNS